MGGGFSKQSLADHAANYKFRALRKKSDGSKSSHENNDRLIKDGSDESSRSYQKNDRVITNKSEESNRSHGNNDRVITHRTPSAKLLDNNVAGNKDDRQYLNSERNRQSISSPHRSLSPPTNLAHTPEYNPRLEKKESIYVPDSDYGRDNKDDRQYLISERTHQSISSPPSISSPTNVAFTPENNVILEKNESIYVREDDRQYLNSDGNRQSISSPRRSIFPQTNMAYTPENNLKLEKNESICVPDFDYRRDIKDDRQYLSSDRNPQSISSPRRSISPPTNMAHTPENNPGLEKKENIYLPDSDYSRDNKDDHQYLISDRTSQSISSPRRSISSPINMADTLENNIKLEKKESIYVPQTISSPRRSISPPTNMARNPENNLKLEKIETTENNIKLEKKESIHVADSDFNTLYKKDQDKDDPIVNIDYHEDTDDEYGRRLSDYDGWVGSPSFREYCVKDYLKTDNNTCDGEKVENKGKGVKPKEDPTPMSTKKGRRIRRIKKVISMGNPSGMRNLLHVSACYSPGNSSNHQKLVNNIEKNP